MTSKAKMRDADDADAPPIAPMNAGGAKEFPRKGEMRDADDADAPPIAPMNAGRANDCPDSRQLVDKRGSCLDGLSTAIGGASASSASLFFHSSAASTPLFSKP